MSVGSRQEIASWLRFALRMSIVPAPTGAVVPIRRSSVGSSKRQKAVQEDHFVVQVPDDVAERLRAAIRGESAAPDMGVVFGPEPSSGDARTATFRFDGEELPARLAQLPTTCETHKSLDGVTFYKTGTLGPALVVEHKSNEAALPAAAELVDGLAPPAANIRQRRFRKRPARTKREVLQVELELEAALRGADPKPEYELVDEERTEWDEVPDGAGADGEAPADRGLGAAASAASDQMAETSDADAALPSAPSGSESAVSDREAAESDAERAEREAAEATAAAAEREAAEREAAAAAEAQQAAAAEAQQAAMREHAQRLREKQQALTAKRTDLDKLRTNPAMANPTLAARMQPKIAEREAEAAALTAEVAALQRAVGS